MAPRQSSANLAFELTAQHRPKTIEMLRLIVDEIESHSQPDPAGFDDRDEQIILDAEVSGARYLLVRLPKPQALPALSPREQEIARMVGQGHSNKIIADVLSISSWTVCTHLRRIFSKLEVTSRAAMIARILDHQGRADHVMLDGPKNGTAEITPRDIPEPASAKLADSSAPVHARPKAPPDDAA